MENFRIRVRASSLGVAESRTYPPAARSEEKGRQAPVAFLTDPGPAPWALTAL